MIYPKHVILEQIFEVLRSNGRQDLIDKFSTVQGKVKEKICKAKKAWKCGKCKAVINIGDKYFCKTIESGKNWESLRYCLNCHTNKEEVKSRKKMRFIIE